jgi:hypothetical protein
MLSELAVICVLAGIVFIGIAPASAIFAFVGAVAFAGFSLLVWLLR